MRCSQIPSLTISASSRYQPPFAIPASISTSSGPFPSTPFFSVSQTKEQAATPLTPPSPETSPTHPSPPHLALQRMPLHRSVVFHPPPARPHNIKSLSSTLGGEGRDTRRRRQRTTKGALGIP